MREIKFRAWFPKEKIMADVHILHFKDGRVSMVNYVDVISYSEIILREFTGLKDKNGKEIYEGDVITFKCQVCEFIHQGKIIYLDDLACFGFNTPDGQESPLALPAAYDKEEILALGLIDIQQVIGNIYENPELMNEKKTP